MVQHPFPRKRQRQCHGDTLSPPHPRKRVRACSHSSKDDHWKLATQVRTESYRGMLDIPVEMIHLISDHMDNQDLRAFALTSRFLCDLLLPMYLHRRGLKLKSTRTRWNRVEVHKLEGFTSLGLWSTVPIFHPPEEMFCAFPTGVPEAKSALRSLSRFLQDPSNTTNLEEFHFRLGVFDSRPLMLEAIEMYKSLSGLPLIRLWISGYGLDCLPRSFALRSKLSRGFPTLTSLTISSDHVFAPGLVGITMGMLNQSPIESLTIWMVSLSPCQWSALLGELDMTSLEDIELEGDIPQSALIRFFRKHSGLKTIRVGGNMPLGRIQPSRQRSQSFLPHLHTLHAPLALSYDIIRQASDVSILRELNVEVSRIQPDDPLFCRLVENLQHFQNLYLVGLQLVPCSPPAVPEANPSNCNSDGHPARDLRQVRILSFFQSGGQLSTEDIDVMCAYIRAFPMPETVYVTERGDAPRLELLESLCKSNPALQAVSVSSGLGSTLKWAADVRPQTSPVINV